MLTRVNRRVLTLWWNLRDDRPYTRGRAQVWVLSNDMSRKDLLSPGNPRMILTGGKDYITRETITVELTTVVARVLR